MMIWKFLDISLPVGYKIESLSTENHWFWPLKTSFSHRHSKNAVCYSKRGKKGGFWVVFGALYLPYLVETLLPGARCDVQLIVIPKGKIWSFFGSHQNHIVGHIVFLTLRLSKTMKKSKIFKISHKLKICSKFHQTESMMNWDGIISYEEIII